MFPKVSGYVHCILVFTLAGLLQTSSADDRNEEKFTENRGPIASVVPAYLIGNRENGWISPIPNVQIPNNIDTVTAHPEVFPYFIEYPPATSSYTYYTQAAEEPQPTTSTESSIHSRIFSNISNSVRSGGLLYCPPGDISCLIQRSVGGLFVLLAIIVAGFLAYSIFTGSLSEVQVYRRSASPYASVFDKLSVLDWIAMMEEVYRKFDATSIDCQKRLVCELHQNENTWGSTARKMNDAFSYLQYFELLNLPEDLRGMLEEYLDAANKGRTSQAKCDDLYPTCEFSMKTLISKYNSI